jgi:hypothetical protein
VAGPALDYRYAYPYASSAERERGRTALRLASDRAPERGAWFVRGRLRAPRRATELLLGVGEVARTRYFVPSPMLEKILRLADPVVTSGRERLRFESFSACCGVYARLDLLGEAVEADDVGMGTTNIDLGPDMRGALARVTDDDRVVLSVGADRVELERAGETTVERKVALPLRWLKGFVEVQAVQARMEARLEVDGNEARRFLRALPRQKAGALSSWVERAGRGLRLAFRATPGAVPLLGLDRVRLLEPLARQATGLRLYSDGASSAWELSYPDARFVLVVSAEPARGFSGEGQVLGALAREDGGAARAAAALAKVRAALTWQPRLEPAGLARALALGPTAVAMALAALGTRGLVGFDLAEGGYFQRALPFDLDLVEKLHPRLVAARKLVAAGAVALDPADRAGAREARVKSGDLVHRVRLEPDGARCTCPWYAKYRGARGPCKHVLAATLVADGE